MGKIVAMLAAATIMAGSVLLFQSTQTGVETDKEQAFRQGQILAREIARSGHNMVLSQARKTQREHPELSIAEVVTRVNGKDGVVRGEIQGGTFEARIYQTSSSTYRVSSSGYFEIAKHKIESERMEKDVLGEDILKVAKPSLLRVTFLESMASYCSAVFVQRILPNVAEALQPQPEMLFAPGNNRDGDTVMPLSLELIAGTRVNFILAVDADKDCEKRGQTVKVNDPMFDYTHAALIEDVEDFGELLEGEYAMVQERPGHEEVWRIAFEDLDPIGMPRLADTKQNGYGTTTWDNLNQTYGGRGWTETDGSGYWKLYDYYSESGDSGQRKPDFSDQVIEVELVPILDLDLDPVDAIL